MSEFWIITRETESLLTFRSITDIVIFLFDHQSRLDRYRILKNKGDSVVEVHLNHLKYEVFREVLERS